MRRLTFSIRAWAMWVTLAVLANSVASSVASSVALGGHLVGATAESDPPGVVDKPRIVFLAGNPSHGYGSHEHLAGCRILAEAIERGSAGAVDCQVYSGGWPEDDRVLDGARAIVMYADGGGGHPALPHLSKLGQLMDQGVGLVCLHYAVEVPTDRGGPEFLAWLGGYFETHWSVNPHWEADYQVLPVHPVANGVRPFKALDEWYFHMRFQPQMAGVTPILSAVPPQETMRRPDGPHSGNPAVRQAVANGEPQHTAWVYERPNGGRSFGFTGGHFHWNWGREEILKLVCNAILWTAKVEVPADGLQVVRPGVERLEDGQDYPPPGDYQREQIQREFRILSRPTAPGASPGDSEPKPATAPRKLAQTGVITVQTPGHAETLEVDVTDVRKLFLVVNDGGNGFACDWADWIAPILQGDGQPDLPLTQLEWTSAQTQWGQVQKGRNAGGGPLRVAGQRHVDGIGTHANSVIGWELPAGYQKLTVLCGLDNGGTDQGGGSQSSVQFVVYADAVPRAATSEGGPQREPANAVNGLAVAPGLVATLSAAEPTLRSLTNLDVDHRGRVWVCEVMNYRGHNGRRPAGDRILILEDEDGDGVMDTVKVFYQGREIDSAMGICVLGNQVIVSASPDIWVFTDENGDDVPDRRERLFTKTGIPQHDHSAHSFVFGPDGKLYWNFGNTGHHVHDRDGNLVVDLAGNPVQDHGRPYREGMVFRCDLDGGRMEVLGHNFRNNYEVTVDSFGTLWQSDNDDDGNRGVRINYVMEFGNYGYRDELTGAGWQAPRHNLETSIPERHWHLNDPGVVPTLLLTGAGSPAGIAFYEGDLLPEAFRNQMIHCDPGPNVVRGYPTTVDGAGFQATILPLVEGVEDKWFRPADVCVAPDGSLFVSDWYDPGVGGHAMGDLDRGRLYRIAPEGAAYRTPAFDWESPAGAVQALRSPNHSVRYMAWQAIQKLGELSLPPLRQMVADPSPQMRARALWAWGKLPGQARPAVQAAASDTDPQVRCVAIRLARQTGLDLTPLFADLTADPSAAVRRELALALRFDDSAAMPDRWAALAQAYDGRDRWYLEALGIGGERRWDECFAAYVSRQSAEQQSPAFDVVWRARTAQSLPWIVEHLRASETPAEQVARLFRALDYHEPAGRAAALAKVVRGLIEQASWTPAQEIVLIQALLGLPDASRWLSEPRIATAVRDYLTRVDRPSRLDVLRKLPLPGAEPMLISLTAQNDTVGIAAAELLLQRHPAGVWRALHDEDDGAAVGLAGAIAAANPALAHSLLTAMFQDETLPTAVRVLAAKGLTRTEAGANDLLESAEAGTLYPEARLIVGSALRTSPQESIRQRALAIFPAPQARAAEPLPPIDQLVQRSGNVELGEVIYRTVGTCANCHPVTGQGKNVGPDLSLIGDKLAKEALYVSILDPSAGISHSYESYAALTDSGQVVVGLMVSQTEGHVVLKDAEGIERTLPRAELEELKVLEKSLMPDNLVEAMSVDDLVNLVEYLTTLRQARGDR